VDLAALRLTQRDGVSCGPAAAVVAGVILDSGYGAHLLGGDGRRWFDGQQVLVHAAANRVWPRALGTTPWGMAAVIGGHALGLGVRYGWRLARPGDPLADVVRAVAAGWPVAMLIGNVIPRHWVLIVGIDGPMLRCYQPASGEVIAVPAGAIRRTGLAVLGFPRAFAFVLPRYRVCRQESNI
jgi:hypothetical protein